MAAYKVSTKIDQTGEIRLSELPFQAGEVVEVIILRHDPEPGSGENARTPVEQLPPVTRRLLGIARGVDESDYRRYLEDKHQ